MKLTDTQLKEAGVERDAIKRLLGMNRRDRRNAGVRMSTAQLRRRLAEVRELVGEPETCPKCQRPLDEAA